MPKGLGLFLVEKRRGELVIQPPEGCVRAAEVVGSHASTRILSSSERLLIGQEAETQVLIIHPLAVFKLRWSIYSRSAKAEGPPGARVSQAPAPHPSHHEHLFSFFPLLSPSSFPHPDSPLCFLPPPWFCQWHDQIPNRSIQASQPLGEMGVEPGENQMDEMTSEGGCSPLRV